jgi:hypothetical protein
MRRGEFGMGFVSISGNAPDAGVEHVAGVDPDVPGACHLPQAPAEGTGRAQKRITPWRFRRNQRPRDR